MNIEYDPAFLAKIHQRPNLAAAPPLEEIARTNFARTNDTVAPEEIPLPQTEIGTDTLVREG